jgi:L-iditol 2-dehydrogenase
MKVGRLLHGAVALADQEAPVPGPGEITVALAACGVCGTDLEKLRGNYRSSAGILGHEPAGVVRAVGPGAGRWNPGDRVFVHHHVPCYACAACRRGDTTFCPEYSRSNLDPGGFAEVFRVSADHVRKGAPLELAPSVSWEEAALLEPAACALTALRLVRMPPGASVFIAGLGPVGILYARLARALGAAWVGGTELSPLRAHAAERGGVDAVLDPRDTEAIRRAVHAGTDGAGVDLSVVATSAPAALELAAELPRRGGVLNLFGLPESGTQLKLDLQQLYLRGLRVIPTYATTEGDIADVHALLSGGRIELRDLVTHRFPLERIEEAFALAGRPAESIKVVVTGPGYDGGLTPSA